MRFLIIGGLIALVAFVGGGGILGRKLPGPFQYLSRTGLGFLLLGMLMGPIGLDVFDASDSGTSLREALAPITALALAWIGMLYGSHLEWARLKRFGTPLYRVMLLEGALALVAVSVCAGALLWVWRPNLSPEGLAGSVWPDRDVVAAALFCGAAAAGTAPAGLFLLRQEARIAGPIYERLLFFCTLDDLPGLVVLIALFAFVRPLSAPDTLPPAGWFVLTIGVALALSLLFRLVLRPGLDDEHIFLVLLGALGVAAGVCGVLHLSTLPVGVLAGALTVNYSRQKERLYRVLQNREHTIYILFLVLAGSLVRVESAVAAVALALIAVIMVARMAGKAVGATGSRAFGSRTAVPLRASLALIPQGGMTVAMAASFAHSYAGTAAQVAAGATVIAVVLNDLLGAELAPYVLDGVRD